MIGMLMMAPALGTMALVIAAFGHLRDRPRFRAVLVSQDVIPFRLTQGVATAVPVAELIVAATATTGLALNLLYGAEWSLWLVGPQILLLTCFVVYLARLLALGRSVPCGCFGSSRPVTVGTLARVASLAALSWLSWLPT